MQARLLRRSFMRLVLAGVIAAGLGPACRPSLPPQTFPRTEAPGAASFTKPISFAILEDYDKGDALAEVAQDFALFKELGVTVWRGSIGWDDYEPERGRFDFEWLKQFAALANSSGITLRPYLGYTPAWAARGGKDDQVWNDPPKRIEDWRRFVTALAGELRHHRSVRSYEIYNEENVPLWWDGTVGEYAAVLRAGSEAVRRADPDAEVLLGGMVWPDPDWLEGACGGEGSFETLAPDTARIFSSRPMSTAVPSRSGSMRPDSRLLRERPSGNRPSGGFAPLQPSSRRLE